MKKALLSVATVGSILFGGFAVSAHAAGAMKCDGENMSKMCAQMCAMDDKTAKSSGNGGAAYGSGTANMNSQTPGAPFTWGG